MRTMEDPGVSWTSVAISLLLFLALWWACP